MKEFIEKLIGRLEEYKYSHLVEHEREMLEHCAENESGKHCDGIDCFWCVCDKSIEIVNELAEEHKGGWIPCENELPDTSEWHPSMVAKEFLVTYYPDEVTKPWVGIRYFRKHTNDFLTKKEEKVIAWQPLPPAFNPKGE